MGKPKKTHINDPNMVFDKQAQFNRVDQENPYGSARYEKNQDGSFTLKYDMSPELYGAYARNLELSSNPYDYKEGSAAPGWSNDLTSQVISGDYLPAQRAIDDEYTQAAFTNARSLLDPVYADQERALTNRLANQGLPTGGEAYNRAFDTFNRGRSNAYNNAAFQAINAGDQRANTMFNQEQAALTQALGAANQRYNFGESQRQYDNNAQLQLANAMYGMNSNILGMAPKNLTPTNIDITGPYNTASQIESANKMLRYKHDQNTIQEAMKYISMIFGGMG